MEMLITVAWAVWISFTVFNVIVVLLTAHAHFDAKKWGYELQSNTDAYMLGLLIFIVIGVIAGLIYHGW